MSLLVRLPQKLFWGILSIFGFKKPEPPSRLINPPPDPRFEHPAYKNIPDEIRRAISDPSILRNPPYQEGYYGLIAGEFCMYEFQSRLLSKIKGQAGLTPEDYKAYLKPMLVKYAELVHLLPASEDHHHNTPGGLLRHGLESAAFMLDWMVLRKFDHELTPGQASMRLRRWYVAGIIAALFHDAAKPLTDVTVMSFDGKLVWHLGNTTIHEWCLLHNLTRYFISWNRGRHNQHNSQTNTLLGIYTTEKLRAWLTEGGFDIWQALNDAVAGLPGPLTEAVRVADSRSVKADRERGAATGGNTRTGVPIQRLCVDAMRRLHEEGQWTFNEPGSRLWLSTKGLFLAWASGWDEIVQQIVQDKVSGFPRSENTLLAAMVEHELLEKAPDGSPTWFVAPLPLFKHGKPLSLRCVKLKNPDSVFPFLDGTISPVSVVIGRNENARENLTPNDARVRKEQDKQAPHAQVPSKPGEKTRRHKTAPARTDISLPANLEERAKATRIVEPHQRQQQPEPHDDQYLPVQINDNSRAAMLHEINGTSPLPPVQPAQTSATDKSAEDEPILKFKLTCSELLNPETIKSPRPKQRPVEPAEKTHTIIVPAKRGPLQTPHGHNFILDNPELGVLLLELIARGTPIREVRNRAFIPLDGKLTVNHLPAIEQAGWLWHDITSPDSPPMLTLRGTTGFLASIRLSLTCCRLTGADWQPRCRETRPAGQQEEIASLAHVFRAFAVPEPSHGPHVWSIPFWARDRVAEEAQIDPQVADEAICYGLEAVRVGRVRKYFFKIC